MKNKYMNAMYIGIFQIGSDEIITSGAMTMEIKILSFNSFSNI
ncbi:MAG: hypothetical protein N2712_03355 [Brevinematales bacterium]|nr:hypothetical protein [Brevinematales bacterium]